MGADTGHQTLTITAMSEHTRRDQRSETSDRFHVEVPAAAVTLSNYFGAYGYCFFYPNEIHLWVNDQCPVRRAIDSIEVSIPSHSHQRR